MLSVGYPVGDAEGTPVGAFIGTSVGAVGNAVNIVKLCAVLIFACCPVDDGIAVSFPCFRVGDLFQ